MPNKCVKMWKNSYANIILALNKLNSNYVIECNALPLIWWAWYINHGLPNMLMSKIMRIQFANGCAVVAGFIFPSAIAVLMERCWEPRAQWLRHRDWISTWQPKSTSQQIISFHSISISYLLLLLPKLSSCESDQWKPDNSIQYDIQTHSILTNLKQKRTT